MLRDINLAIRPGETVAFVGPSGAGKTTICSLLPRFYEVDAGSITIDGIDIREMTLASLRRQIGIVQQDVFLFCGHDPREYRLRPAGRDRGGDHGRRPAGRGWTD